MRLRKSKSLPRVCFFVPRICGLRIATILQVLQETSIDEAFMNHKSLENLEFGVGYITLRTVTKMTILPRI